VAWAAAPVAAMLVLLIVFAQDRSRYAAEAFRSRDELAILYAPGTVRVSFGNARPQGTVFVNPREGVLLTASALLPTPADKIYEMWLIPKGAKPVPAGLFQSFRNGDALHVRRGAVDIGSTAAVAVTIEDKAGAAQPTSTPVIVAPLPSPP
jgi:anti-sigma-K factor RskA